MKILCVYDPSLIFIPHARSALLYNAVVSLDEHNAAQEFYGFKIALSGIVEIALFAADQTVLASVEIILNPILQRLMNSRSDFHFVAETPGLAFEAQQDGSLFADYVNQETLELWQDLIGSCLETDLHVCYASWSVENGLGGRPTLTDNAGRQLEVSRNRYDWGEAYRQIRRYSASLLPNTFIPLSTGEAVFAFCPPDDFLEDEQDLSRLPLPRNMVESGKWREVGGNRRGYTDRWENFWMWNQNRGHWDVQITEHTRRAIEAPDHHLNVECAGKRAPGNGAPLEGHIVEGYKPNVEAMHRFSVW